MKAGWKLRIDERRYFEEKKERQRQAKIARVIDKQMFEMDKYQLEQLNDGYNRISRGQQYGY